jgi:hypothetical protein
MSKLANIDANTVYALSAANLQVCNLQRLQRLQQHIDINALGTEFVFPATDQQIWVTRLVANALI